jgi:hypothetical protein
MPKPTWRPLLGLRPGTEARARRKSRRTFAASIAVPSRVVNTKPVSCHCSAVAVPYEPPASPGIAHRRSRGPTLTALIPMQAAITARTTTTHATPDSKPATYSANADTDTRRRRPCLTLRSWPDLSARGAPTDSIEAPPPLLPLHRARPDIGHFRSLLMINTPPTPSRDRLLSWSSSDSEIGCSVARICESSGKNGIPQSPLGPVDMR